MTLSTKQIATLLDNVWQYYKNNEEWVDIEYNINPDLMQFYNFKSKHKFSGNNLIYVMFDFMRNGKTPSYMTKNQIQELSQEKEVLLKVPDYDKSITLLYPRKKFHKDKNGQQLFYVDKDGNNQPRYSIYFTFYNVYNVDDIEGFDKTWLEEDVVKTETEKYSEFVQKRLQEADAMFDFDDYHYMSGLIKDEIEYQDELIDAMYSNWLDKRIFNKLVAEFTLFMLAIETNTSIPFKETAEFVRMWINGKIKTDDFEKEIENTKEQLYQAISFASKRCELMLNYGKQK